MYLWSLWLLMIWRVRLSRGSNSVLVDGENGSYVYADQLYVQLLTLSWKHYTPPPPTQEKTKNNEPECANAEIKEVAPAGMPERDRGAKKNHIREWTFPALIFTVSVLHASQIGHIGYNSLWFLATIIVT